MQLPFTDRKAAGRLLAEALSPYADVANLLVLALPRGGVPVAFPVAQALGAELDLLLVRKLGLPDQEELAMGAIADGGVRVLNEDLLRQLYIADKTIEVVARRENQELRRRQQVYRGQRPAPQVAGRTVILVDDGLATGATMRAAVAALQKRAPGRVVAAAPVAPPSAVAVLSREADAVVCLATPEPFYGVGRWYRDFSQTSDEEVRELLVKAWHTGGGV